jgi:anthranilate synthase/aminodeoxychorismate synthase-like glutamine amidotransferase
MKNTKLLILDNRDSFTYNIVDSVRRIENVDLDVISTNEVNINEIEHFDKIIISPGPGRPNEYPVIYDILEKFYRSKNILGICLGHQAIGNFFSAKLTNILPVVHGQADKIKIIKQSPIYKNLPKSFRIGLYHSWAIDFDDFPEELEITAVSENNRIMSIASKKYPVFGIQFHPESYLTDYGFTVLKNFIDIK